MSLYFSFTNKIFISAIGALVVLLLPFVANEQRNYKLLQTPRKILILLSTFLILCICSVLLTHPSELLNFEFYRRDGNVFITFASLLTLICSAIDFDIWTILKRFVYISTFANLVAMGMFFILPREFPEYTMFFVAHNAAGGFLGILCICNFALFRKKKIKWLPFLCLVINLFGLYLTDSRGSVFPLIGTFVFLFIYRKIRLKDFDVLFNFLFFFIMFAFTYYVVMLRGADILVNRDLYVIPEIFSGGFVDKIISSVGRGGTIINRLYYLYPQAVYMFSLSPIFGTGMGTFNDVGYNFVGIENIFSLNISEEVANNASHAHNSFFHIMAENGLVGLFLIVGMLWYIRKFSKELKDKQLSNLIFLSINYVILTSFFEHRLFAPAEMLPFVYILGMIISRENYNKKQAMYLSNQIDMNLSRKEEVLV